MDLFQAGYWWESHEIFEALWNAAGRRTQEGSLLKALILLAAAELKRASATPQGAPRLKERARRALAGLEAVVLGVDVRALARSLERCGEQAGGISLPLRRTLLRRALTRSRPRH